MKDESLHKDYFLFIINKVAKDIEKMEFIEIWMSLYGEINANV